CLLYYSGAVLF
nr:immunoglobulin light chain junction region [Macaca mulatta]MPN65482.1 immunoglobulin light chain junction region [Macaca mulatta]MPN69130.1 immunoglobulin light chain junction region [Macaca mulatta]